MKWNKILYEIKLVPRSTSDTMDLPGGTQTYWEWTVLRSCVPVLGGTAGTRWGARRAAKRAARAYSRPFSVRF